MTELGSEGDIERERHTEKWRERESSQVRSYSKCAGNRFSESSAFMVLVIKDYTNHLKLNNERLFSNNKKVLHAGHILHSQGVNQEQIK